MKLRLATSFSWLLALLFLVSAQGCVLGGVSSRPELIQDDPPQEVYRVDERPPDQIFRDGFRAWGRNDYLYAHVLGVSLIQGQGESSYFIATTDSLDAAFTIARRRWEYSPTLRRRPLYLYTIRATQNMYEVDAYMAQMETNPPEGEDRRTITQARQAYRYQREWVATERIAPEQIQQAVELGFREGQQSAVDDYGIIVPGNVFQNTAPYPFPYVDSPTRANGGLYPRYGAQTFHRTLGSRAYILDSPVDLLRGVAVSLAYCPDMPRPSGTGKMIAAQSEDCNTPTPIDLNKERGRLVSILSLILMNED